MVLGRRPNDPLAPQRKRPKRIAKRYGMLRVRGGSYTRFARAARALAYTAARSLNTAVWTARQTRGA